MPDLHVFQIFIHFLKPNTLFGFGISWVKGYMTRSKLAFPNEFCKSGESERPIDRCKYPPAVNGKPWEFSVSELRGLEVDPKLGKKFTPG
jgi:hypothetical protein